MPLSKNEIEALMHQIGLTTNDEINCEQCLSRIAEFAERELQGKSRIESLAAVEQHLSICAECREEYEMLQRALREMGR